MSSRSLLLLLITVLALPLAGCDDRSRGEPPEYTTDVYVADLSQQDGRLLVGDPLNLTRREGYDNQPVFLADGGGLLYASRRDDQVDIYRFDLRTGTATPVAVTPQREYQPCLVPGSEDFSVVRVELDGQQQIWRFDLAGGEPELLVDLPALLRYHAWLSPTTLATVDSEMHPNLWLYRVEPGDAELVIDRAGRSLQRIPGRNAISFVHVVGEDEVWIKEFDLDTAQTRPLVLARPGSEDHAWTPDGLLLMAQGSRLFQWTPAPGAGFEDWQVIADFSLAGLLDISRLAVSPKGDRLALVNREPQQP